MDEDERERSQIPRPKTDLRPDVGDEDGPAPGYVSRKRFAGVLGVATATAVFSLVTFMSVGMVAGAIVGPGMGGFVAEFGSVSYSQGNAEIYPTLADHAACDNAPQLEVSLKGETTLNGNVTFYKDLPLPSEFDTGGGETIARLSILADAPPSGIPVQDLELRFTALEANRIIFNQSELREYGPNSYDDGSPNASFAPPGNGSLDPTAAPERVPELGLDATDFTLPDGGVATAHHVSFGNLQLENINIFVVIDEKSDLTNPVENVVEPQNRTCAALASA